MHLIMLFQIIIINIKLQFNGAHINQQMCEFLHLQRYENI